MWWPGLPLGRPQQGEIVAKLVFEIKKYKKYPPIYKKSIKNCDINQPTKIDPDLADMDTSCYTSPGDFKMFLFFHSH